MFTSSGGDLGYLYPMEMIWCFCCIMRCRPLLVMVPHACRSRV